MKSHHTTSFFTGHGGVRLFCQHWRPTHTAPPKAILVFIHGMAEHSERYQHPVAYFSERGFESYAMDLRGHGNSDGRHSYANSLEELLHDIRIFLEKIKVEHPKTALFLIGHSFGGQLVLNYGVWHPNGLKGIIASSPNIRLRMHLPLLKRLAAPIISKLVPRLSFGNELNPSMVCRDPQVIRAYEEDPKIRKRITARLADIVLENQLTLVDLAARFHVPAFLMHAGDDKICCPSGTEEFFKRIPIKEKAFKVYEGFYHELFNEVGRDQVFADMEKWIEKRLAHS